MRAFYYDTVEFTRKSMLVGLTVLFERGSMVQLEAGLLIASLMMAIAFRVGPCACRCGTSGSKRRCLRVASARDAALSP